MHPAPPSALRKMSARAPAHTRFGLRALPPSGGSVPGSTTQEPAPITGCENGLQPSAVQTDARLTAPSLNTPEPNDYVMTLHGGRNGLDGAPSVGSTRHGNGGGALRVSAAVSQELHSCARPPANSSSVLSNPTTTPDAPHQPDYIGAIAGWRRNPMET